MHGHAGTGTLLLRSASDVSSCFIMILLWTHEIGHSSSVSGSFLGGLCPLPPPTAFPIPMHNDFSCFVQAKCSEPKLTAKLEMVYTAIP